MKSPLHPSDEEALQTMDAMMHGDVASSREKYEYITKAVESWTRLLAQAKTARMRRALDAADEISQHLCILKKDEQWRQKLDELHREYNDARSTV